MARSRQIKPDFFINENLALRSPMARLLFIGLWLLADREGRLEDRPARIKAQLFPYHEADIETLILELMNEFIERYSVGNLKVIHILNFNKHQHIHPDEKQSIIPKKQGIPGDLKINPEIMPSSSSTSSSPSPSSKLPQKSPSAVDYSNCRISIGSKYPNVHLMSIPVDECVILLNTPRLSQDYKNKLSWKISQKTNDMTTEQKKYHD